MEFKARPTYDAILPARVRFDDRIYPIDKLIYAEIFAWCRMSGKDCYAEDSFIGSLCSVDSKGAYDALLRLEAAGYIKLGWLCTTGKRRITLSDAVMFDE